MTVSDCIRIEHAAFSPDVVERLTMGAGVIPVSRDPNGEYHLFLGRERYQPSFRGSCRWSGFEGSRKEGESAVETASREFQEESLGVITKRFTSHDSWIRVVLNIENDRNIERYHCTYILPVAWDAEAPSRFMETRLGIEMTDQAVQEWRHSRPAALGVGCDVGEVSEDKEVPGGVCVQLRGGCLPSWPGHTDEHGTWHGKLAGEAARGVKEWQRHRARTERAIHEHAAVIVRRDEFWNMLQDVTIAKDYLEKDMVAWWSVGRLRDVITSHGTCGNERFRPYFLPVLQTVLDEIDNEAPECPQNEDAAERQAACEECASDPTVDRLTPRPRVQRPPGL